MRVNTPSPVNNKIWRHKFTLSVVAVCAVRTKTSKKMITEKNVTRKAVDWTPLLRLLQLVMMMMMMRRW